MNEKLSILNLIDLLAEKHGMSRKNAESFVKEFFQLIEESLEKDKYVKIKGLGTFKLIDVESRESVNVNTGERFEIQGHTKVSFTPEPSLKDIINKPFAHFESVVLNDNTVLEDTPVGNDSDEDDDAESKKTENLPEAAEPPLEADITPEPELPVTVEEPSENTLTEDEPEKIATIEEAPVEPIPETDEKADSEPPVEKINEKEEIPEPEPEDPQEEKADTPDANSMKYFIGIVIFIVVLCAGAVLYLYFPDMLRFTSEKRMVEKVVVTDNGTDTTPAASTDSLLHAKEIVEPVKPDTVAETVAATSSVKVEEKKAERPSQAKTTETKPKNKKAAAPIKPDSVGYTIVGTETTYTIKEGETLTRVALRFYGTKALWPYIVKHNPGVIKNPDNVPYGTKIKIPKLAKKQ